MKNINKVMFMSLIFLMQAKASTPGAGPDEGVKEQDVEAVAKESRRKIDSAFSKADKAWRDLPAHDEMTLRKNKKSLNDLAFLIANETKQLNDNFQNFKSIVGKREIPQGNYAIVFREALILYNLIKALNEWNVASEEELALRAKEKFNQ